MQCTTQESKKRVLEILQDKNFRVDVHDFPSGCCMIDVWKREKFYVVQIEPEFIGISLVDEPNFTTIPDERFYDLEKFSEKLKSVLNE